MFRDLIEKAKAWLFFRPDARAEEYFADESNWTHVLASSNVLALAYFADVRRGGTNKLRVKFRDRKSGGATEVEYDGVPVHVLSSLIVSESTGAAIWTHIRRAGIRPRYIKRAGA